jgi:hypothetical protein
LMRKGVVEKELKKTLVFFRGVYVLHNDLKYPY